MRSLSRGRRATQLMRWLGRNIRLARDDGLSIASDGEIGPIGDNGQAVFLNLNLKAGVKIAVDHQIKRLTRFHIVLTAPRLQDHNQWASTEVSELVNCSTLDAGLHGGKTSERWVFNVLRPNESRISCVVRRPHSRQTSS